MCGRYNLHTPAEILAQRFQFDPKRCSHTPRTGITPSQNCLVVAAPQGERLPATMTWGFINPWTSKASLTNDTNRSRIINARSETVATKPTFKDSFLNKRCIIPADAFFESKDTNTGRKPYRFALDSGEPFAMAGVWRARPTQSGIPAFEFVILTVPANNQVQPVHNRMPALLLPEDEQTWLDPTVKAPRKLAAMLNPYPSGLIRVQPVLHQTQNQPQQIAKNLAQEPSHPTAGPQPVYALLGT